MAKRLELFKELVPSRSRVAVIGTRTIPLNRIESGKELKRAAAREFGRRLKDCEVRSNGDEIEKCASPFVGGAADAAASSHADALFLAERGSLSCLAARHPIPAIYACANTPTPAASMSYGASIADAVYRAAAYVGRILKGEKPGDLPVEQADQIRVRHQPQDRQGARPRLPPTLLARADEVIE